ncbi:G patch domain and ankyrin repeat-containing protein 1 [Cheilinus undulatus]|uniref:G patch domain and ankyrin repeat-containing protein 1 n=1 Tax=Cheilinus undulatus TaxID=241271 RepID=UPI001BD3DD77|nr:G patch domain and ankyrin repeat-containing protein 1 [Cheilinus undulatus]
MAHFGFTRASGQDVFSIESTSQSSSKTDSALCGEEARQFYENLVKDRDLSRSKRNKKVNGRERQRRRVRAAEARHHQTDSVVQRGDNNESDGNQSRETNISERSMELMGLRLLRCAHEGDITGLKDLLSRGVDINFQDTYFWTAVMCASWSGQRAAVKLLLQHGAAWVGVVDTQGRDAKDLAMEAGHSEVLEELESYGQSTPSKAQTDKRNLQPQWCSVCRSEYSSSLSSHLSSTLHQFSLQRPSPTPYYCLPPSSNSYKMMVRSGWKPGTGLGPEGDGPKQPVPTVLKRDQTGLGFGETKRAKVTHFQARDHDAVKPPSKTKQERGGKGQRKEDSRRKEQRDKNWERDFRASFYL